MPPGKVTQLGVGACWRVVAGFVSMWHILRKQHGSSFPWAHHLWDGPRRSDVQRARCWPKTMVACSSAKQTLGTCDVTSLARKEPKLFCLVRKFRVDLVGFTSTKGLLSGLLERDWTPFHSRVAHVERHRAFLARYLYIGVHPDG